MSKKTNQNKTKIIISIIQLIFIIILIYSLINIFVWYKNNKANKEVINELSQTVEIVEENKEDNKKYKINFEELKNKNSDTIAWIKVENTSIEFPVVKTNDNSYYLTHNFNKQNNSAGWIFADYKNRFDGKDKNIVIYGHNMLDDSMFGTLKNVIKKEWYNNENNRYITLITENEYSIYEVFSVYQIEKEDYYIKTDFNSDKEFEKFLQEVKKRSIKDFNIEISKENNILTLSTCANNSKYRVVLPNPVERLNDNKTNNFWKIKYNIN